MRREVVRSEGAGGGRLSSPPLHSTPLLSTPLHSPPASVSPLLRDPRSLTSTRSLTAPPSHTSLCVAVLLLSSAVCCRRSQPLMPPSRSLPFSFWFRRALEWIFPLSEAARHSRYYPPVDIYEVRIKGTPKASNITRTRTRQNRSSTHSPTLPHSLTHSLTRRPLRFRPPLHRPLVLYLVSATCSHRPTLG